MRAVVAKEPKSVSQENFLVESEVPMPTPAQGELLVQIKAVAFNPVDYKRRQNAEFLSSGPKILGWDAAGIVASLGAAVSDFRVGDEVFYSGELMKPGSNAEYQCVDARLVGKKPKRLSFGEAASLPLTSVTAWEALFHKLRLPTLDAESSILVIGGAGGVGSIATQLLRQLTRLKVLVTASRAESIEWCKRMGAHGIVDRRCGLVAGVKRHGVDLVNYCFATTGSKQYAEELFDVVAPFGEICMIDDPEALDLFPFKMKSISIHWELMFTRSLYNFKREEQGEILNQVSALVDEGRIIPTSNVKLKGLSAETFMQAHRLLESGESIGKVVAEW